MHHAGTVRQIEKLGLGRIPRKDKFLQQLKNMVKDRKPRHFIAMAIFSNMAKTGNARGAAR
jgi:hypothetical protein